MWVFALQSIKACRGLENKLETATGCCSTTIFLYISVAHCVTSRFANISVFYACHPHARVLFLKDSYTHVLSIKNYSLLYQKHLEHELIIVRFLICQNFVNRIKTDLYGTIMIMSSKSNAPLGKLSTGVTEVISDDLLLQLRTANRSQ